MHKIFDRIDPNDICYDYCFHNLFDDIDLLNYPSEKTLFQENIERIS